MARRRWGFILTALCAATVSATAWAGARVYPWELTVWASLTVLYCFMWSRNG